MDLIEIFKIIVDKLTSIENILSESKEITFGKDPNELLTIQQINVETGIGIHTIRKMFKDPEMQAQTRTKPFKVTRSSWNKYLQTKRDYIKE